MMHSDEFTEPYYIIYYDVGKTEISCNIIDSKEFGQYLIVVFDSKDLDVGVFLNINEKKIQFGNDSNE